MLGEGVGSVEGGGGWRKRFNYTRESDILMGRESSDMLMAREYARLSETEAAALLEEKDQDLVLAAELGNGQHISVFLFLLVLTSSISLLENILHYDKH